MTDTPSQEPQRASSQGRLGEIARLFLKLGITAFGGPAAHIAMMEDEIVTRRKWISRQHFLDLIGATHDLGENKFDGDDTYVRRIRTSQFSHDPDQITRIVFDLTGEASYDVSTSQQAISKYLTEKCPKPGSQY